MVADYREDFKGMEYFPYTTATLSECVRRACRWAEKRLTIKERALNESCHSYSRRGVLRGAIELKRSGGWPLMFKWRLLADSRNSN